MDPTACLQRFLDALEEARNAHDDLSQWLGRGGFSPEWTAVEGTTEEEAREAFVTFSDLPSA